MIRYMEVNAAAMTRRVSPLEEDKKKAALLEKLLKSKDPSDLMKANKLIKKMVELVSDLNLHALLLVFVVSYGSVTISFSTLKQRKKERKKERERERE